MSSVSDGSSGYVVPRTYDPDGFFGWKHEDWKNGVCPTDPVRFSAAIAERQQELENERGPGERSV